MKPFRLFLSFVISATSILLCHQVISKSIANQQNKMDYAEINHIRYGLLSVNAWKRQLSGIISDEIGKLNLSHANEEKLKKHVETQLASLIDNVEERIRESNTGTMKGWIKQSFINALVDMKVVKAGIPEYADEIVEQMKEAKTEKVLKGALKKRIELYLDKTFENQDLSPLDRILKKVGAANVEAARNNLDQEIATNQFLISQEAWFLIALSLALFAVSGFTKSTLPAPQYFLLLLSLTVLLLAGVTTPMIDMEAKISEMSLTLLGHPIKFENQVLYFQSKSILDVFWIMITHKDLQMKAVGVLMVAFSVVFPLVKMISSVWYYFNWGRARDSRWVQFFVEKSGKWSMADVLVVAIFMAYIGFNGIIASQFSNIASTDEEMLILTTNGTSLQPGFYIFLTYTLLAMVLSGLLTSKPFLGRQGK